jgi:palmitoyl-protein thioesterase
MTNIFLSFILIQNVIQIILSSYPVVVFHGISDNCNGWMAHLSDLIGTNLNVYSKCIESSADKQSVFHSIKYQAELACNIIKSDPNLNQTDFSIVGVSQGSLIGRYIIEKCDIKGKVRKYVSIGGPQMGVGKIPHCTMTKFLCNLVDKLAKGVIYSQMVQNHLAPAGYLKDVKNYSSYIKNSIFLPDLNNEKENKNKNYKNRFGSLDKLVLIKFSNDTMVVPKESEWFEFYGENEDKVINLQESKFYQEDFIGLRKLNEEGKVAFIEWPGDHIQFKDSDIIRDVIPNLK